MVFRDALASRDLEPPPDCGGFVARYTVDMSLQTLRLTSAALVLLAALAVPAFAQAPTPTPPGVPSPNATPEGKWVQPPADVPKALRADRTRNIEFLFEALKIAPDDVSVLNKLCKFGISACS